MSLKLTPCPICGESLAGQLGFAKPALACGQCKWISKTMLLNGEFVSVCVFDCDGSQLSVVLKDGEPFGQLLFGVSASEAA